MPTIDFKNHVPGVDPRLPDLPDRLAALGLDRPAGLDDALFAARWEVPTASLDELRRDVETAKDEAAYGQAVNALADAYARRDILAGTGADAHKLRSDLTRISAGRVQSAFRAAALDIYARIGAEYAATEFAGSVRTIRPESLSTDVFGLDQSQKTCLDQAKRAADRINLLIDAYNEVSRLAGHTIINGGRQIEAEEIACRFGEYDTMQDWASAADLVEAFANDRGAYDPGAESANPDLRRVRFSVFGPAAAVALAGGRLVMSTPRRARETADEYRAERALTSVWTGVGDGRIPV